MAIRAWAIEDRAQVRTRLGGIETWIRTRLGEGDMADVIIKQTLEAMGITEGATAEEVSKGQSCGFKKNGEGLYIEGRQVKAMIKESANILRPKFNMAAFKAKVAERVFVAEDKISLGVKEPTGYEERPIHVMTAQGERTALKRSDYVKDATIKFTLKVLDDSILDKNKKKWTPEEYLEPIFAFAEENGLGADRSQEQGKFNVTQFETSQVTPDRTN